MDGSTSTLKTDDWRGKRQAGMVLATIYWPISYNDTRVYFCSVIVAALGKVFNPLYLVKSFYYLYTIILFYYKLFFIRLMSYLFNRYRQVDPAKLNTLKDLINAPNYKDNLATLIRTIYEFAFLTYAGGLMADTNALTHMLQI